MPAVPKRDRERPRAHRRGLDDDCARRLWKARSDVTRRCGKVRKYVLYARRPQFLSLRSPLSFYFDQPSGGFFLSKDFRTAACHGPVSFRRSGFGPGADFGLLGFLCFFFTVVILSSFGGL